MIRSIRPLVWILAATRFLAAPAIAGTPQPELARLKSHVETLASVEFGGRRGPGAIKSRAYLIDEFRRLGLQPLFEGKFTQDVIGSGPDDVIGVNVGAMIPGSDPSLVEKWVILGAHYDHLGARGLTYYPGADDNASGVAMMLEVARSIVESPVKPRRSIAFVGFDLEEQGEKGEFGLRGSKFFVAHSPIAMEKVTLFVTADMIGRSLGGVCDSYVFVLGSESVPEVRPWLRRAAQGQATDQPQGKPIKVGLLGADLTVIDRSDYGPFRSQKVPFLFFTTGENPVYHTTQDRPETINYPKLESISRIIHDIVREALDRPLDLTWSTKPDYPIDEALALRDVFRSLLDHRETLKLKASPISLMEQTIRLIDEVEVRGAITLYERNKVARTAQYILFTVF